jgi:hypothetical protein
VTRLLPLLLLAACGGAAAPHGARAIEALRAGDLGAAEAEAAHAHPALRDFVRGNVAFARSERAEAAAARPGAPPSLLERAAADAEDALAFWRRAAASREEWPEARRNVERALLRLARLRGKKTEGGPGGRKPERPPEERPAPPPRPPDTAGGEPGPEAEVDVSELPPERVLALLEALRRREAEKRALRQERRRAAGGGAERDW